MKKIILALLVVIYPLLADAQFFSGELSSKKKIIAKTSAFDADSAMSADLGPEMTYLNHSS